jgi:hypothetical protein
VDGPLRPVAYAPEGHICLFAKSFDSPDLCSNYSSTFPIKKFIFGAGLLVEAKKRLTVSPKCLAMLCRKRIFLSVVRDRSERTWATRAVVSGIHKR